LHSMPPLGSSRWNIAMPFGMGKLEWFGYPMVKNFENMSTRFDATHERDGRTDGQTDGHRATAIAVLMHSITRQKWNPEHPYHQSTYYYMYPENRNGDEIPSCHILI